MVAPNIPSYATTSEGILLIADGVNYVKRWDGLAASLTTAGVLAPTGQVALGASGSGTISGTYYAFLRFFDSNDNPSDPSPISGPLTVAAGAAVSTILYSNVQVPTESRVVRRQLLRNTSGQASVFYVDVDTTDLTSTTFSSTKTDSLLSAEPAVPLFDSDNLPFMAAYARPPDWKSCLAAHRDLMFAAGEVVVTDGCVRVANGSVTVSGVGTAWPVNFAGRWLWVDGGDKPYQISSVAVSTQTLTLDAAYAGATNPYARYAIRPAPAEQRLVYFSTTGDEEAMPAFNALALPADDDQIMGLMPMSSWLFVLERSHTYRLTYKDSPIKDGAVFLSIDRGCVNNRCWVIVEQIAYLMDEAGVYSTDGSGAVTPLSAPIQDMWESEHYKSGELRIQWSARRYFHAVWYPAQEVIRWFVTLAGRGLPQHALCLEVRRSRWWVEQFSQPMGSSCLGRLTGEPKVMLGGSDGKVNCFGIGALDVANATLGTVRGQVDSAGLVSVTDPVSAFSATFVGSPLSITAGRGEGQQRIIVAVSGTTLRVDRPWIVLPDSTSTYQVGGVQYQYRGGWLRWTQDEKLHPRRLEVNFYPARLPCTLSARLLTDRATDPSAWASYYGLEFNGLASNPGSPDLVADLTKSNGVVQRRLDARRDYYLDGDTFVSVEMAGVSNADPITIISAYVDGAIK